MYDRYCYVTSQTRTGTDDLPRLTVITQCGFSKHMTSVTTSTGAPNRFKFCTRVARQQHNRSPLMWLSAGTAVPLSLKMVN